MNNNRIFWGVCFVLGAVLLIINQVWGGYDIGLLKIFIAIICVAIIAKSVTSVNFLGILLPLALLYSVFYDEIAIDISKAAVWGAAFLGSIGLDMIFKDRKKHLKARIHQNMSGSDNYTAPNSNIAGEKICLENAFGHSTKYVSSDNFITAKIENSFGAIAVYFDNAIIQNGKAEIRVENAFGEISLYIPKNWQVNNLVSASFGAFKESGKNQITDIPVVDVVGSTAFGSINVYYI